MLLTTFLGFFAAKFPDDAPLAKLAIDAGVGTGLALIQAFLAVIVIHFLAMDARFPVGMKTAIHRKNPLDIISFCPETAISRYLIVNLRARLCGVYIYASAQPLDFLDLAQNISSPIQKLK